MEPADAAFHVPIVLQGLCYLSGMSVALSAYFWLWRRAGGRANRFTLRQMCGVWLARVLTFCAAASLAFTFTHGFERPAQALPEISILLLTLALYLIVEKKRYKDTAYILTRRFPMEILKIIGVAALSAVAFALSIWLGAAGYRVTQSMDGPIWLPAFMVGLLWILPLPYFISVIRRKGLAPAGRYSGMVWPFIFAIFLIMLPDFIEYLGNSPKVAEMARGRPRLQRA